MSKIGDQQALNALAAFKAWTAGSPGNHDYPGPGLLKTSIDRAMSALEDRIAMGLVDQGLSQVSKVVHNKREIGDVMEDPYGRLWFLARKRRMTFGAVLAAVRKYFEIVDPKMKQE